jgi:hypothetical protein
VLQFGLSLSFLIHAQINRQADKAACHSHNLQVSKYHVLRSDNAKQY